MRSEQDKSNHSPTFANSTSSFVVVMESASANSTARPKTTQVDSLGKVRRNGFHEFGIT